MKASLNVPCQICVHSVQLQLIVEVHLKFATFLFSIRRKEVEIMEKLRIVWVIILTLSPVATLALSFDSQ